MEKIKSCKRPLSMSNAGFLITQSAVKSVFLGARKNFEQYVFVS